MEGNIRNNIRHGALQSMALNMFQPFLGIFAIRLGASNTVVALLASLPALTSAAVMIPGAFWLERQPRRKVPTALFTLASRLVLALMALIPLFSKDSRAPLLAALIGLMNLPAAIATVSWQALMAEVFPLASRARIFALRNRYMSIASLIPILGVGYLLDRIRFPLGYQIFFLVALAVSLLEIMFLLRLNEGHAERIRPAARRSLAGIRQAVPFWRFTFVSLIFYFAWQMGWPLFTIYQVRYLGATNLWTALFSISITIAAVISSGWWGKQAERRGVIPPLVLAAGGLALTPIFFVLAKTLWPVIFFNLIIGVFTAGAYLLFFTALLETVPAEDRAAFIAYNNTLVNIAAFLAPLAGSLILDAIGIKGALLVTSGARFAGAAAIGVFLARPLRQPT